uniref:Uncharacterized protein n=1 Tax=Timema monikensis TaxID=170555 RepID=A0A7R9EFR5_9NEOP|nr:unnamed protein product [Timema monikensis]
MLLSLNVLSKQDGEGIQEHLNTGEIVGSCSFSRQCVATGKCGEYPLVQFLLMVKSRSEELSFSPK